MKKLDSKDIDFYNERRNAESTEIEERTRKPHRFIPKAVCTKCGERILADEDALCGNCAGEPIAREERTGVYPEGF